VRQHLIATALLLLTSAAHADTKKTSKLHAPIDIRAVVDQLDVFKDDAGSVLVVPKVAALQDDLEKWVFYGDTKSLYQQRIVGNSVDGDKYQWIVWSPRVQGLQQAFVSSDPNGVTIQCTNKKDGHRTLTPLPQDQARKVLAKATFLPPLWERQAHFLARDDDGVYFYVDELQEEYGGKGYRVFVGKKGALKEAAMTNVVSDSAGEIYSTKTGELKIVAGADGKAYWKKGGKKTELVVLDVSKNRYVIYRDLGIYGTLGIVCDEQ
jgi:hypothetical protein